jgi:hypothetical protein
MLPAEVCVIALGLLAFEPSVMTELDIGAPKVIVPPTVASVREFDALMDPELFNTRFPLLTKMLTKLEALIG